MSAENTTQRLSRRIPFVTVAIVLLNVIGLIYEYSVGENTAIARFGMYQGLENHMDWWRYALIYLIGIIGSGLLINFAGGRGVHAGASGAIWSLMTATLVYNLRNNINPAYALRGIVVNLVYSFSAGVSWQGHIGGGVAGLLAAAVLTGEKK